MRPCPLLMNQGIMSKLTERPSSTAVGFMLLMGAALGCGLVSHAADQPQWGERFSRNMVSSETGLPDSFDPDSGRNIKWVAPLGTETHSSPIIAGGRVYIGTNNN